MAWGTLAAGPSPRYGCRYANMRRAMVPGDVTCDASGRAYPWFENKIRVPSFGAVVMGCQFGNMPPGPPVPAKRRTAHVVPVVLLARSKSGRLGC